MIGIFFLIVMALLVLAGILVVALSWLAGGAVAVYGAAREWQAEAQRGLQAMRERRNEVVASPVVAGSGNEVAP